jgi:hypothetical protein
MEFKVPPGNLWWITVAWTLLGGYFSYDSFANGDTYYGVASLLIAIAGILVWLDVRAVAWPLMIWFGAVVFFAVVILLFKGLSFRPFFGIVFALSMIHELYQWRKRE